MQAASAVIKPAKRTDHLPSAKKLLTAIQYHKVQLQSKLGQHGLTKHLARELHNVALLCMVFGHLPPIRLSCISSLVLPNYQGPCHKPDCVLGPTCHGNQAIHSHPHSLQIHLPHHKNEIKWGRAAIQFQLPPELSKLMQMHMYQGHALLTGGSTSHVFFDNKMQPFSSSTFNSYWTSMLSNIGAPTIAPSQCRQVFVDERRSAERVPGPADRGASMVMGHSLKQWDKWYDVNLHSREAQQAVNAMDTWRHAVLSSPDQPSQQACHAASAPLLSQLQLAQPSHQQHRAAVAPGSSQLRAVNSSVHSQGALSAAYRAGSAATLHAEMRAVFEGRCSARSEDAFPFESSDDDDDWTF